MSETKVCRSCEIVLPVEAFTVKAYYQSKKTGLTVRYLKPDCKACTQGEINQDPEKKERRRIASMKYLEQNREKTREKQRVGRRWQKPEIREKLNAYKVRKRIEAGGVPLAVHKDEKRLAKEVTLRAQHARRLMRERERRANPGMTKTEYYAWRYANDPAFQIKERLRNQIKKQAKRYGFVNHYFGSVARKKMNYKKVWDLVGYSSSELHAHIERQFTRGMTWEKFLSGEIHIDHIIPKSTFDLDTLDELRACYALSNLRPAFARDNLRKGARRVSLL
jgi:hypothetical protein